MNLALIVVCSAFLGAWSLACSPGCSGDSPATNATPPGTLTPTAPPQQPAAALDLPEDAPAVVHDALALLTAWTETPMPTVPGNVFPELLALAETLDPAGGLDPEADMAALLSAAQRRVAAIHDGHYSEDARAALEADLERHADAVSQVRAWLAAGRPCVHIMTELTELDALRGDLLDFLLAQVMTRLALDTDFGTPEERRQATRDAAQLCVWCFQGRYPRSAWPMTPPIAISRLVLRQAVRAWHDAVDTPPDASHNAAMADLLQTAVHGRTLADLWGIHNLRDAIYLLSMYQQGIGAQELEPDRKDSLAFQFTYRSAARRHAADPTGSIMRTMFAALEHAYALPPVARLSGVTQFGEAEEHVRALHRWEETHDARLLLQWETFIAIQERCAMAGGAWRRFDIESPDAFSWPFFGVPIGPGTNLGVLVLEPLFAEADILFLSQD